MISTVWQVLFWSWLAAEIFISLATRTWRGGGKVQDRGSHQILWIVIVAAMIGCGRVSEMVTAPMFGGAHWLKIASVGVLVSGLAIRGVAVVSLGKAFSANVAIRNAQKVKSTGMYRWVRHPSYLGLLLVFLAVGMHSRNWIGLAVAVAPTTVALLYRIHIEEAALNQAFGEEYRLYSRGTKRLIPGVY